MKRPLFTGSGAALVTPFSDGRLDLPVFRALVRRQLAAGTDALIVCATTGEAAALSADERRRLIDACLEEADGRAPVIVGSGSNDTAKAAALSREAEAQGADGLLVVTPYYNKATQAGLVAHFTAVADAVSIPLILYNVPSRTGVSCSAETYAALAAHPNVLGVKEASGNFALVQETRRICPADFYLWSGNDEDTAAIMLFGGLGVISVTANLFPGEVCALTNACRAGRFAEAGAMQVAMAELNRALFCEVNPIPIKTAMAAYGLCGAELRLPLCPMGDTNRARLLAAASAYAAQSAQAPA